MNEKEENFNDRYQKLKYWNTLWDNWGDGGGWLWIAIMWIIFIVVYLWYFFIDSIFFYN